MTLALTGSLTKGSLGAVRPCAAPGCTINTHKRFVQDGVTVVACCPGHANKSLAST